VMGCNIVGVGMMGEDVRTSPLLGAEMRAASKRRTCARRSASHRARRLGRARREDQVSFNAADEERSGRQQKFGGVVRVALWPVGLLGQRELSLALQHIRLTDRHGWHFAAFRVCTGLGGAGQGKGSWRQRSRDDFTRRATRDSTISHTPCHLGPPQTERHGGFVHDVPP
jgi:hypothetical protein